MVTPVGTGLPTPACG